MKIALALSLLATVVVCVLCTPLGGFETRAASDTMPLGFAAVGVFFVGVLLDSAAVVMLALRRRAALTFSLFGPVLFFPVVIVERIGFFSAYAPPPAIAVLEAAGALLAATAFALTILNRRATATAA